MTILFCPLFLDEPGRLDRNLKWLKYVCDLKELLGFDVVLMVDNASSEAQVSDLIGASLGLSAPLDITRCNIRLPRFTPWGYPFWYRAFRVAMEQGRDYSGLTKIVHIDSDAFVLSKRLCDFIKDVQTGWHGFWCESRNFPEVNIQVICQDQFPKAQEFFTEGFLEFYPYYPAELIVPFTEVHKEFKGDRYGELGIVQAPDMDYYCQARPETKLEFVR